MKDTNVNKIAGYLRKEIISGNLKPGDHLKENKLAQFFRISRVPVREALRILHSEGYLDMFPNKGSFVKRISLEYIHEILKIYLFISPELLRSASPKYKDTTYRKAEKILDNIEKCRDMSKIGFLLWDFAKVIYSPSTHKFMLALMDELYMHNIRILNDLYDMKNQRVYDLSPHKKFLNLCKQKKAEEAISTWLDYIKKLSADFIKIKIPNN